MQQCNSVHHATTNAWLRPLGATSSRSGAQSLNASVSVARPAAVVPSANSSGHARAMLVAQPAAAPALAVASAVTTCG